MLRASVFVFECFVFETTLSSVQKELWSLKVSRQMEGNNLFSLTLVGALLGDLERKAVLIKGPALIEWF